MVKHVIITDKNCDFIIPSPDTVIVNSTDFLSNRCQIDFRKAKGIKVINLCNNYDYLSTGYYCSLLSQARQLRCIPDANNILTLNWRRLYQNHLPELNAILENDYTCTEDEPSSKSYTIHFGRSKEQNLDTLARRLFDLFRFPLMQVQITLNTNGTWVIGQLEPLSLSNLAKQKHDFFNQSLKKFTGSAWRTSEGKKYRYWVAILHDPQEKNPPSNKAALQKFIKTGKDMGVAVELITKNDLASVSEYDALLIRETTAIDNHTFRFARKAEGEFLPVIDDSQSIIRCCNKVFQYEILEANKIPIPRTHILDKKNYRDIADKIDYPAVIKIPDGAFSKGVIKVENIDDFVKSAQILLRNSDIILAQEFVQSTFDWRIGVLNGAPLYACKYYMAEGHWQIYNHGAKTIKRKEGDSETIPISAVPEDVLKTAINAASLIGNSLYGVDLKQNNNNIVVMEINDNPNIDAGVEDLILGDKLYKSILGELTARVSR